MVISVVAVVVLSVGVVTVLPVVVVSVTVVSIVELALEVTVTGKRSIVNQTVKIVKLH